MLSKIKEALHTIKLSRYGSTNLESLPADHFDNIGRIGMLFNAETDSDVKAVTKFSMSQKKSGRDVALLGYFDSIKDPGPQRFPYFTSRNLNISLTSKSDVAKQFTARNFDVLINLDYRGMPAVNYIAAASKAYFKIGPANSNSEHYDLLIDLTDNYRADRMIFEIRRIFNVFN